MNSSYCSVCLRQVTGGFQFCPYCGHKLPHNVAPEKSDCPSPSIDHIESDDAIKMANEFLNNNDFEGARSFLEKLVLQENVSPKIHYLYFKALFNNGKVIIGSPDYLSGLTHLKLAIEIEPDFSEGVAYNHFCNFLNNRQAPGAFQELELAYKLLPEDRVIKFNYGVMLFNQKEIVKANYVLKELKNSISKPKELHYYHFILWFLSQISYYEEHYSEAISEITESIKYAKLNEDKISEYNLYCYLGGYLWMNLRDDDAFKALKHAQALLPDQPFANSLLAATRGFFRKKKILLIHGR